MRLLTTTLLLGTLLVSVRPASAGDDIERAEVEARSIGEWSKLIDPGAAEAVALVSTLQDAGDLALSDAADTNPNGDWTVDVQPYVWVPFRIDGDVTVKGVTANIDLTLSDIFDKADVFGLQGRVEGWKNRFGYYMDGMYVSLDGKGFETTVGPISIDADLKMDYATLDFGIGWRIVNTSLDRGTSEWPRLTIDLLGGARYQYLKVEINRTSLPTLSDSRDWLEPVIGGRVNLQLDEHLSLAIRGDAGGFGIGSASDLTWNLAGGIDIKYSETFSLRLAYRVMGLDGSNGSGMNENSVDVTMHGPLIGLSFRF